MFNSFEIPQVLLVNLNKQSKYSNTLILKFAPLKPACIFGRKHSYHSFGAHLVWSKSNINYHSVESEMTQYGPV